MDVTKLIVQILGACGAAKRCKQPRSLLETGRTFTLHDPVDWKPHILGHFPPRGHLSSHRVVLIRRRLRTGNYYWGCTFG